MNLNLEKTMKSSPTTHTPSSLTVTGGGSMNKSRWIPACAGMTALLLAPFIFATPPTLPTFPPLQFQAPKPERVVLDNGLTLYLLEDHELPLVRLEMSFQGGTQADPVDKIGLGAIFGESMTYGGSARYSPETMERELDRKAASLSFGVSLENGSGNLSCRKEDFDALWEMFSDLLLHPQFRKDKFEIAKSKALEGLRRMNDDPDSVSRREFRRLMYGGSHPYARIPSPAMFKNIKRDDLLAAHARYMRPNGSWIAISGDFVSAKMIEKVKASLGSWPKRDVSWAPVPEASPVKERRVYYIQRPINQTQIRLGNFGLARHNPDHYAWEVFNELWGGSAGSRLFRTIRTEQGLAYAVGSGYSEPAKTGLIVAVSQTRGAQTMAAIQSILKITQDVRRAPFTDKEIHDAKEAIRNRFIENFTSSAQIVSYRMNLEVLGFPKDYLDTYTAKVSQVSRKDLERVGQKYLQPEQFSILVLGDLSTFDKPMATLGKPQEVKLTDYSQEN